MCGEKAVIRQNNDFAEGSPPRVRGKDQDGRHRRRWRGITPACAGKRTWQTACSQKSGDHPRVCGEKRRKMMPPLPLGGSPPRVRGKVRDRLLRVLGGGITPACAGKSNTRGSFPAISRDHPRVCGEKRRRTAGHIRHRGSPPRVRGKALHGRGRLPGGGITPACAGKSIRLSFFRYFSRDHPRVCGEKIFVPRKNIKTTGSPPRVRGKAVSSLIVPSASRITPACAGKSKKPCVFKAFDQDHPRVCGEKLFVVLAVPVCRGSPPRVRGKDQDGRHRRR